MSSSLCFGHLDKPTLLQTVSLVRLGFASILKPNVVACMQFMCAQTDLPERKVEAFTEYRNLLSIVLSIVTKLAARFPFSGDNFDLVSSTERTLTHNGSIIMFA